MRVIVGECSAEYSGRLNSSLPRAKRVVLVKADDSVLIFSEKGSYKPLNWMVSPCVIKEIAEVRGEEAPSSSRTSPIERVMEVTAAKKAREVEAPDHLVITFYSIETDFTTDLGEDPGLQKDGVEKQLQAYLARQMHRLGEGTTLIRREYLTPIGPIDILAVDAENNTLAVEIKRHGGIEGVDQLSHYVEMLNKDPRLAPVQGVYAAQTISRQARVLARQRGFRCVLLDYEDMKRENEGEPPLTLFDFDF